MSSSPTELDKQEEEIEESSTDRLLFLSDGVFAIVITLLVLEIKVPSVEAGHHAATLAGALRGFLTLWPSFLGYALSFVTVGIMWANHCVLFRYIKKSDHLLMILNLLLLLIICFVPFVTAVLAEYLALPAPYPQAAVVFYTGSQFFMAVAFSMLWRHASHENQLLDTTLDPQLFERVTQRYRFGPLIYLACFCLAFIHVGVTLGVIGLLTLIYALPYGKEAHAIEERLARLKQKPRQ